MNMKQSIYGKETFLALKNLQSSGIIDFEYFKQDLPFDDENYLVFFFGNLFNFE